MNENCLVQIDESEKIFEDKYNEQLDILKDYNWLFISNPIIYLRKTIRKRY